LMNAVTVATMPLLSGQCMSIVTEFLFLPDICLNAHLEEANK
jgi:hypothetical protein